MIKRLVKGEYADPNSTRDLTGFSPNEFRVLIDFLRQGIKSGNALAQSTDAEFIKFFAAMHQGVKIPVEKAQEFKKSIADDCKIALKIFYAINRAYPGATYEGMGGQIYKPKTEEPLKIDAFPGCENFKKIS